MRTWKLLILLAIAGAVPIGLAQEQWIRRWSDWLQSVPVRSSDSSPQLQTAPYSSSGSNSYGSASGNSQYDGNNKTQYDSNNKANANRSSSSSTDHSTSGGSGSSWTSNSGSTSNSAGNSQSSSSNSGNSASGRSNSGYSGSGQDSKLSNNGFNSGPPELEAGIEGPPSQDLREVFRFDVHPKWVLGRWPRISTVNSEPGLEGLRVPLVTGRQPGDLSGALTYYFDTEKVLQRITFHGYTGDEQRLVELVTAGFKFKPVPSLGAGLYIASWNGKPRSALRMTYAPVIKSTDPLRRIEVILEFNRARAYYSMSAEFQELLEQDRAASRW